MKKRIVIGDYHSRWSQFQKIYTKEEPDEVIILGDYFDPYNKNLIPSLEENFKNLLELRNKHLEDGKGKWIMLMGNHDLHYCSSYFSGEPCTRYSIHTHQFGMKLLEKGLEDLVIKLSYVDDKNKTIYTHSGLTNYWVENLFGGEDIHNLNFIHLKNKFQSYPLNIFDFNMLEGYNGYGDTISQSPMWVRPNSLIKDTYKGYEYTQIVGHTNLGEKPLHTKDEKDYRIKSKIYSDIWFIDNLEYGYYMVETLNDNLELQNREIKKI